MTTLLNRRSGGGDGHIEPRREPELPRGWPGQLPFRKRPKPYSRAITWTPGDSKVQPDRKRPYELFVSQSVLRQVRGHLLTARSGEPYGFLIGQVVHCPWSEAPYIVIDAVRRESQNLPPANDMDRFRHAWVAATRDARHRRSEVIGWYHRHGVLGLRLSEWDLHLQEEFFPEPWHCALIVASTSHGIIGGFIQRSPRARLFRKGLAPFHELVDLDAKLVAGRKPSFVDWENYGAGEPVSVLKARWPAPQTRLERWKSPDHDTQGDRPAEDTDDAPASRHTAGSRALRGRSWRTPPAPTTRGDRRPAREGDFSEEEFAGAVGLPKSEDASGRETRPPARDETDGVETVDSDDGTETAAPVEGAETPAPVDDSPEGRKRRPDRGRSGKKAKAGAAADPGSAAEGGESEDVDDTEVEAAPESAVEGAWYSAEFAEAVWGRLPFGLEAPESPDDEASAPAPTRTPSSDPAAPPHPRPAGTTARFELVPPFATEPDEEADDDPRSLAWLVSLIGATLARPRGEGETTREASAGSEAVSESTDHVTPEAPAGDPERPAEAAAETSAAPEESRPAHPAREPARTRPPLATPASARRRKTFVATSRNPEEDPEAEIPVVLFHDRRPWRPPPGLVRIAAVIAILVLGALAVRAMGSRGPSIPPPAPAAQPPSLSDGGRPTPEFVELADAYLSGLQSYRERLVQHGLGQVDCERLTRDFSVVVFSHRALVRYVAATPSMADRLSSLDAEMGPARQRFEASGCTLPADLEPEASPGDPASPVSPAS